MCIPKPIIFPSLMPVHITTIPPRFYSLQFKLVTNSKFSTNSPLQGISKVVWWLGRGCEYEMLSAAVELEDLTEYTFALSRFNAADGCVHTIGASDHVSKL